MATALEYKTRFGELDLARNEIRLLWVSPITDDDIHCHIVTVSLDDRPYYQALSYVWGDATMTTPLRVGNSTLFVTINLKEALLQLSRMSDKYCLWVDALCINQKDEDEKSSQVALMKNIYNKATSVVAWLGPTANESTKAIQSLKILAKAVRDNKLKKRFPKAAPANQEERAYLRHIFKPLDYGMDGSHSVALMPIEVLMNREWWRRVWTFQELVVARDFIILCGCTSIRALGFNYAIYALRTLRNIVNLYALSGTIGRTLNRCQNVLIAWSNYKNPEGASHMSLSMINLLEMTGVPNRTCSDARDHVFGLLGIAQDHIVNRIRIDYRRSVVAIYTEVAWMLISNYGLDVLAYCYAPADSAAESGTRTKEILEYSTNTEEVQEPDSHPSWVPDWHTDLKIPMGGHIGGGANKAGFCASKCIRDETPPVSVQNNRILKCLGTSLDEVRVIHGLPDWESLPNKWFKAIASMIAESEIYKSPLEKEQALWRTPCADQVSDSATRGNARRVKEADSEKFIQFVNNYSMWSRDALPLDVLAYVRVIRSNFNSERRVYATKKGYLGLGPRGIRPGDIVCILASAKVPHVLRRVNSDYYSLIGESYVHGVMDGEYKLANPELRDFKIV